MTGWTCSVCGEANAPTNERCVNGPHAKTVAGTSTAWQPCMCGTSAMCPVHPRPKPSITINTDSYVYRGPELQAWNVDDIRSPVV